MVLSEMELKRQLSFLIVLLNFVALVASVVVVLLLAAPLGVSPTARVLESVVIIARSNIVATVLGVRVGL